MPADIRLEADRLILDGPITLHSHAATPAQPTTVDVRVEPTGVTVTGQLNLPRGCQVIGLETTTLVADSLHFFGETLSDLPPLPALPAPPTATTPPPTNALGPVVHYDRTLATLPRTIVGRPPASWAKTSGVVVDHQLDALAYLKLLHRHLVAAYARIDALEKRAR